MRSTAIQYVGIDVHQATLVCVVKNESGQTIMESKLATRGTAIVAFVKGLGGRVRVAFEEGTQAQWLYDLIRPVAEEVIVCDPRKIVSKGRRTIRQMRSGSASCSGSMRSHRFSTSRAIADSKN